MEDVKSTQLFDTLSTFAINCLLFIRELGPINNMYILILACVREPFCQFLAHTKKHT